jgi:MoaA/NifB/PqqE/SkfB family radical SAM enzyme
MRIIHICFDSRSPEAIKKELVSLKKTRVENVVFDAREPLRRRYLNRILDYAISLGFKRVGIATGGEIFFNALLFKTNGRTQCLDANIQDMVKKLTHFRIRLYGHTPELHDKNAKRPGSFIKTITGLRNIRDIKSGDEQAAYIEVEVGLNSGNYPYLVEIIEFTATLGVDRIVLSVGGMTIGGAELRLLEQAIESALTRNVWVAVEGMRPNPTWGYNVHVSETETE